MFISRSVLLSSGDEFEKVYTDIYEFCSTNQRERNCALDHLVELIRQFDPKSNVLGKMSCARTKTTAITDNVISLNSKESILEAIRANKFSLLTDESTDSSSVKNLATVAWLFFNVEIHDTFADLFEVNDCTSQGICERIVDYFTHNNIDYKKNMTGFGADGGSVMVGSKNSVVTRLLFVQ